MTGAKPTRSKQARLLSTILYAIAAALVVVVVVLYFKGRGESEAVPPTPQSVAGQNELINVVESLQKQGLTVKQVQASARADELSQPGQGLDVNGAAVYVFLYPSPEDRTADSEGLDPTSLHLVTLAGTPVPTDQLKVFSGSNAIAVLAGGDDAIASKIAAGMKALP